MIWKTLEQYSVIGIQFLLQIILARIIEPSSYGIIAIVGIFIGLSNVFIQNGFSVALVRQKEIEKDDISSVFYFSVLMAALFYAMIFCVSPYVSRFFSMPELDALLKVMSVSLFPQVYCSIQNSLLRRQMDFKAIFITNIISVAVSGILAIFAAYRGMGVWALALQHVLYCFLFAFMLGFYTKWFPSLVFSIKKVQGILSFGWKVLVTSLFDELFNELRSIVIGRYYTSSDLAFFNRGKQFPNLIMKSTNGSLQAVLLPKLSQLQDNKTEMFATIRKSVSVSTFITFPILTLLAVSAAPLIELLLTEKWLPCVIYLQLHCLFYATWPVSTTCSQALYAVGRSDVVAKLEIPRKIIDFVFLVLSMSYGVLAIAASSVLVSVLSGIAYLFVMQKYLGYKVIWNIKSLAAPVSLSAMAGLAAYLVNYLHFNVLATLSLQIVCGLFVYMSLAYIFKVEALRMFCINMKAMRKGK